MEKRCYVYVLCNGMMMMIRILVVRGIVFERGSFVAYTDQNPLRLLVLVGRGEQLKVENERRKPMRIDRVVRFGLVYVRRVWLSKLKLYVEIYIPRVICGDCWCVRAPKPLNFYA